MQAEDFYVTDQKAGLLNGGHVPSIGLIKFGIEEDFGFRGRRQKPCRNGPAAAIAAGKPRPVAVENVIEPERMNCPRR